MMRRLLPLTLAALALGAFIGGCGSRDAKTTAPEGAAPGLGGPTADSSQTPGTPGVLPDGQKMPEMKFRPETFAIKPSGVDGWKPTRQAPQAEPAAVALGTKADRALAEVGKAYVETQTNFDIAGEDGGRFNGKATLKFDGPTRYAIEYYTPETKATLNEVIANGDRRAKRFANQWDELPPVRRSDGPLTDEETAAWPMKSLSEMFSPFTTGRAAWGPVLRAWSEGKAGYKVTVEERTAKVNGQDQPFVRVIATTQAGRPTTVEVTFDGTSYLPLTLRVNRKEADGKESNIMWNGRWGFGGQHDPKAFEIPAARPR